MSEEWRNLVTAFYEYHPFGKTAVWAVKRLARIITIVSLLFTSPEIEIPEERLKVLE